MKQTEESKYIQQHLANERTYLAWIRTSIAIIGVGFLATTLHFNTPLYKYLDDNLSMYISLFSLVLGLLTSLVATLIYFRIRRSINTQTFQSSFKLIVYMTTVVFAMLIFFGIYYVSIV